MRALFLKYNLPGYCLFLLALFPVLPKAVDSIAIGLLVAVILLNIVYNKVTWTNAKTKGLLVTAAVFFIYVVSLAFTEDIKAGIKFVVKCLPLLALPLAFTLNDNLLQNNRIRKIKAIYVFAILCLMIFLHIKLFNNLYGDPSQQWDTRKAIESLIKVHGTYLSMWIGFAIIIIAGSVHEFTKSKNRIVLYIVAVLIVAYLGYWQFLIITRMPFVATVVVALWVLVKKKKYFLIAGLPLLILGGIVVFNSPGLGQRFNKLKEYDFSFPKGVYAVYYPYISTEQIRNGIYYCSWQKIKEAPVMGHGIGDVDNQLQKCYNTTFTDTDTYRVLQYNSHSQYLQLILCAGFVGFAVFLLSVAAMVKKALRDKSGFYLAFLAFVLFNFLFENILSRHDGILFFAFFNSIFYFNKLPYNEKSTN